MLFGIFRPSHVPKFSVLFIRFQHFTCLGKDNELNEPIMQTVIPNVHVKQHIPRISSTPNIIIYLTHTYTFIRYSREYCFAVVAIDAELICFVSVFFFGRISCYVPFFFLRNIISVCVYMNH